VVAFVDKVLEQATTRAQSQLTDCEREVRVYERQLAEAQARCKQLRSELGATTREQKSRAAAKEEKMSKSRD
jgi:ornithine cyclodeaminase/alanine dehydrogenase-like protein (mu-crystallin family)